MSSQLNDLKDNDNNSDKIEIGAIVPSKSTSFSEMKEIQNDYREFVCGYGAAFINICVTFPINKLMFRQMVNGVKTTQAVSQLRIEGFHYLYRGLLPPLLQKTISASLMFGTFSEYRKLMDRHLPPDMLSSRMKMTLSALFAGCTEAFLTPLERVQTLLQQSKYHEKYSNTWNTFRILYRNYGIKEFYRGLTPILLRNGASNVLFFSLRGQVREYLPDATTIKQQLAVNFISGALIGAFISTVFYPLNVMKTHMQANAGGKYPSLISTIKTVYIERNRKVSRIYYGVHINYTRALISWGIINASYEILHQVIYNQPKVA